MKIFFIILSIIIFIIVFLFGIFSIHIGMQNHNGCIAAIAKGMDCPQQDNIFEYLFFHFSVFKNYLIIIFDYFPFSLSIFSFIIIGIIFKLIFKKLRLPQFDFSHYQLKFLELIYEPLKRKFLFWLSLHENSPAVL